MATVTMSTMTKKQYTEGKSKAVLEVNVTATGDELVFQFPNGARQIVSHKDLLAAIEEAQKEEEITGKYFTRTGSGR